MSVKIKSFVKQFVAVVKGDDAAAQAEKAFRQADNALTAQIAILNGETVNYEDAVETAKELLVASKVNNGIPISDRDKYINTLLVNKNTLTQAEENLKKHLAKIEFLKTTQKEINTEVDE